MHFSRATFGSTISCRHMAVVASLIWLLNFEYSQCPVGGRELKLPVSLDGVVWTLGPPNDGDYAGRHALESWCCIHGNTWWRTQYDSHLTYITTTSKSCKKQCNAHSPRILKTLFRASRCYSMQQSRGYSYQFPEFRRDRKTSGRQQEITVGRKCANSSPLAWPFAFTCTDYLQ